MRGIAGQVVVCVILTSSSLFAQEIYVSVPKANMRTGPDTRFSIIDQATRGERFFAVSSLNGWFRIELGSAERSGWIHESVVSMITASDSFNLPTPVVRFLTTNFPSWQFARPNEECRRDGQGRAFPRLNAVVGRFNDDTSDDVAVMFMQGTSFFVYAFVTRGAGKFDAHEIWGVPEYGELGDLGEIRQFISRTELSGGKHSIDVVACGEASSAFLYERGHFRRIQTSD